jgi:hypothetical protein
MHYVKNDVVPNQQKKSKSDAGDPHHFAKYGVAKTNCRIIGKSGNLAFNCGTGQQASERLQNRLDAQVRSWPENNDKRISISPDRKHYMLRRMRTALHNGTYQIRQINYLCRKEPLVVRPGHDDQRMGRRYARNEL